MKKPAAYAYLKELKRAIASLADIAGIEDVRMKMAEAVERGRFDDASGVLFYASWESVSAKFQSGEGTAGAALDRIVRELPREHPFLGELLERALTQPATLIAPTARAPWFSECMKKASAAQAAAALDTAFLSLAGAKQYDASAVEAIAAAAGFGLEDLKRAASRHDSPATRAWLAEREMQAMMQSSGKSRPTREPGL